MLAERDRGRVQPRADGVRQVRGGRLLQDLLVAALQRAVALAERHDPAPPVAEDLHLDVARVGDEALEEDARVAETACAVRSTAANRSRTSASSAQSCMPMPPPPALLFSITG